MSVIGMTFCDEPAAICNDGTSQVITTMIYRDRNGEVAVSIILTPEEAKELASHLAILADSLHLHLNEEVR